MNDKVGEGGDVLFQALLLDDMKYLDEKIYVEFYNIYFAILRYTFISHRW